MSKSKKNQNPEETSKSEKDIIIDSLLDDKETKEEKQEVLETEEKKDENSKDLDGFSSQKSKDTEDKKNDKIIDDLETSEEVKKDKESDKKSEKTSKKSKKTLLIAGISVFILVIILIITFALPKDSPINDVKDSVVGNVLGVNPEKGMEDFHKAIQSRNYEEASKYIDADAIANNLADQVTADLVAGGYNQEISQEELKEYKNFIKKDLLDSVQSGRLNFSKPKIIKVDGDKLSAETIFTQEDRAETVTINFEKKSGRWVWVSYVLKNPEDKNKSNQ
jgi:flagellar basal body-associated protein FliL